MKRLLIAALAAASMTLASCATVPNAAQVVPKIERALAAYDQIAATAEILLPYLLPERAARVRLPWRSRSPGCSRHVWPVRPRSSWRR